MKKSLHRLIAFALSLVLVMSEFTVPAYATEAEDGLGTEEALVEDDAAYEADEEEAAAEEPAVSDELDDFHFVTGHVPAPNEDKYESLSEELEGDELLAVTDTVYVSPVAYELPSRDQGNYGTCWAFSTMAAAEFSAITNGKKMAGNKTADKNIDLSELHLAYFSESGNGPYDPLGGLNGDHNGVPKGSDFLNNGGSADTALRVLSAWNGAADEARYRYSYASPSYIIDPKEAMNDVMHLSGFYTENPKTPEGRAGVKKLINDYGAVSIAFWAFDQRNNPTGVTKSEVYNKSNNCYYMPYSCDTNHLVSIVGWNDEFPKEYFATQPEEDGAWLIRNSWCAGNRIQEGEEEGDLPVISDMAKYDSYFWLSYCDQSVYGTCYALDMDTSENYDHNYQYDGCMTSGTIYGGSSEYDIEYASVFTASTDSAQKLNAVYFSTHSADFDYTVYIYKDVTADNPMAGAPVATKSGRTTYAGGYTVTLDEPVALEPGQKFSVVVSVPGDVMMDAEYSSNNYTYVTTAHTSGQSVCNFGQWQTPSDALSDYDYHDRYGDLRIKAFTKDAGKVSVTLDANGGKIGTASSKTVKAPIGGKYGTLPIPTRDNYDFDGWYMEDGVTKVTADTTVEADTDHTLYAHCKGKQIQITLDPMGGKINGSTSVSSCYVTFGGTYSELPEPSMEGYVFDGWYSAETGGTQVNEETPVTADSPRTLYARYRGGEVQVTLDENRKGGASQGIIVRYTELYGNLPTPVWEHNTFLGWFTRRTGGNRIYETTEVTTTSPHMLYAHWTAEEVTVTLDANEGEFGSGASVKTLKKEYGSVITDDELKGYEKPSKAKNRFRGWFSDEGCTAPYGTGVQITDDVTIYAGWESAGEDEYIVTGIKPEGYTYTGSAIEPKITVYDSSVSPDNALDAKTDYTVTYRNNKDASDTAPTVVIKGKGNYEMELERSFKINPASLRAGEGTGFGEAFTVTVADKKYNGKEQISKPSVKFGKTALREGKDYELSFDGPKNGEGKITGPGRVTVTVTGMGNFADSAECEYDITGPDKNIASAYVGAIADVTYTGSAIDLAEVAVTVKETRNSADTLTRGEDYEVRYASGTDRVKAGTAKIEIIAKEGSGWTGRKAASFKIVPADIGACGFDVAPAEYNGSAQKPKVTVSYGGEQLTEGSDYTLGWARNTNAGEGTLGSKTAPTVTVKGKGNFKGSKDVAFTIDPKKLGQDDLVVSVPDVKLKSGAGMTAKDIKPSLKYVVNPATGKTVALGAKDYEIKDFSYEAGKQLQTVKFTLKGNYKNAGEISARFFAYTDAVVTGGDIRAEADTSGLEYTGSPIKPEITVTCTVDGEPYTLAEGKDYKVAYSNNTKAAGRNIGKMAPTWKVTGAGGFKGVLASGTFTIAQKELTEKEFEIQVGDVKFTSPKEYKPSVKVISKLTGKALSASDYTAVYSGNTAATDDAEVTITGKGNYKGTIDRKFRIYANDIAGAYFVSIGVQEYTGRKVKPEVTVYRDKNSQTPEGKLAEGEDKDYILEYGENIKTGTGTVTVIGKGTWGGKKTLSFKIKAKPFQRP